MNSERQRPLMAIGRIISILVLLTFPVGFLSCGDNPVDPEDPRDTTRPTVIATVPAAGDTTFLVNAAISATFSELMDSASLSEGVLSLEPSVPGVTSSTGTIVTFTPTDGLDTNVTYTATVAATARDTAGNNLATPYVWQFRTYLDTLPPTVVETTPADSNTSVSVNTDITVVFSETMDRSTLTPASFQINPSVSGVLSSTDTSLTFDPDEALDTMQWYTVTLTTAITDTIGNHLVEAYVWDFYTYPDTTAPEATMLSPLNGGVVNDSVTIQVGASDNDQVSHVEFYVDGSLAPGSEDYTAPYEYIWDASGLEIGSEHTLSAVAYDAVGNSASTDTVTVHYLWRLAIVDGDEGIPRNLSRVWYRTTNQQIQFRVETWNGWGEYQDDSTGIDVAFFIDADQDSTTGDKRTDNDTKWIGDIGADHQMIIGYHGLYFQNWTGSGWGEIESVEDLHMANDTNMFEVSLSLSRLNDPDELDLVLANIHVPTRQWDWAPDNGHATAIIDRSYSASPPSLVRRFENTAAVTTSRSTPFY